MDSSLAELAEHHLGQPQNTPERVVEVLRAAISQGILKPGQPLSQAELSSVLGVSPIPLREAFRRLEADGLVKIKHNRGAFVAQLSADDIREVYEIRLPLELLALRLAMEQVTESDRQLAEHTLERLELVTGGAEWTVRDRAFHLALYQPCQRPRLLELIGRLRSNTELHHNALTSVAHVYPQCQNAHRQLLAAWQERREQDALRQLEEHLKTGGEILAQAVANGL